jgi:hypothetical protein
VIIDRATATLVVVAVFIATKLFTARVVVFHSGDGAYVPQIHRHYIEVANSYRQDWQLRPGSSAPKFTAALLRR